MSEKRRPVAIYNHLPSNRHGNRTDLYGARIVYVAPDTTKYTEKHIAQHTSLENCRNQVKAAGYQTRLPGCQHVLEYWI